MAFGFAQGWSSAILQSFRGTRGRSHFRTLPGVRVMLESRAGGRACGPNYITPGSSGRGRSRLPLNVREIMRGVIRKPPNVVRDRAGGTAFRPDHMNANVDAVGQFGRPQLFYARCVGARHQIMCVRCMGPFAGPRMFCRSRARAAAPPQIFCGLCSGR